ncbi:hypothetical protein BH10PSE7_BH10PSE7_11570 [soil metagenome]
MNWIFEAYSNVYNSAMMQNNAVGAHVAPAKKAVKSEAFSLRTLLRRG